jgi:hypothetical protein
MTDQRPQPKRSETDPPAANRPVPEGGDGEPEPEPGPDQAGRAANDPSMSGAPLAETVQAPLGKPDGEVDTSR